MWYCNGCPHFFKDRFHAWLRDYDSLQYLALFLIYLQVIFYIYIYIYQINSIIITVYYFISIEYVHVDWLLFDRIPWSFVQRNLAP
jgi:hypothetical protein